MLSKKQTRNRMNDKEATNTVVAVMCGSESPISGREIIKGVRRTIPNLPKLKIEDEAQMACLRGLALIKEGDREFARIVYQPRPAGRDKARELLNDPKILRGGV